MRDGMDQKRQELLQLLKEKSYKYRPEQPFKLASGRESPYYVDCRPTTHNARGLALIGEIFFEMVKDLGVQAVGGLTMGADPIAHAVALTSYLKGRPLNAFSVRKSSKGHGTGGLVVGDVHPGDKVVIVEDVITTGGSTIQAIRAAREFGLKVVKVLVLVDREEGGREAVEKLVPRFEAVFTLSQLKGHDQDLN
jgi:orotate phosphoribosyltransferase